MVISSKMHNESRRSIRGDSLGSLSNRAVYSLWSRQQGGLEKDEIELLEGIVHLFGNVADQIAEPYMAGPETDLISTLEVAMQLFDADDVKAMSFAQFRKAAAKKFRELADGAQAILDGSATPQLIESMIKNFDRLGEASLHRPTNRHGG